MKSLIKQLNSYEDACRLSNTNPLTLDDFKKILPDDEAQYQYSVHRVTTGVKALKQGRKFYYNDGSQAKRYPWWDMETYGDDVPGSGFSLDVVVYGHTLTAVGARLSSFENEDVRHLAKVFEDDYRIIMKSE